MVVNDAVGFDKFICRILDTACFLGLDVLVFWWSCLVCLLMVYCYDALVSHGCVVWVTCKLPFCMLTIVVLVFRCYVVSICCLRCSDVLGCVLRCLFTCFV